MRNFQIVLRRSILLILFQCAAWFFAFQVLAADLGRDIPGSKDIPGLPRYEGAVISGYRLDKFSEARLPLGPWVDSKSGWEKSIKKQGRRTRIIYLIPPDRSSAEVMMNYKMVLQQLGYETLFECSGAGECGKHVDAFYNRGASEKQLSDSQLQEYAFSQYSVKEVKAYTGRATIKGQESFVFIFAAYQDNYGESGAGKRVAVFLEEIRVKQMEERMVVLKSDAINDAINEKGRAAIYGIYFDTDKSVIKPESRPQLEEMSKYLSDHPKVKVFIVDHTDNTGTFAYNLKLSEKRAASVVAILSEEFGVEKTRLEARGVASLAPVAPNTSDAGRAKNRRVEMVLK